MCIYYSKCCTGFSKDTYKKKWRKTYIAISETIYYFVDTDFNERQNLRQQFFLYILTQRQRQWFFFFFPRITVENTHMTDNGVLKYLQS